MRAALPLLACATLVLAACGKADTAPGPGGVTVGEAKALDEAAQMIEDRRLDPDAMPTPSTAAQKSAPAKPEASPAAASSGAKSAG